VAIVTLALGVGAATTIFTVVDGILLRPLPYPHPERLESISIRYQSGADFNVIRAAEFRFLQQNSRSFESLSVNDPAVPGVNLSGGGDPQQVPAAFVSADFFRVLGVSPALGRPFKEDEDNPGAGCVAIIPMDFFEAGSTATPQYFGTGPLSMDKTAR
jgi:hypothetical protein